MTKEQVPSFSGRIIECGRSTDGQNEVVIDVGRGQHIKVSGISDTVVKSFARNLYKHASIEVTIHDE